MKTLCFIFALLFAVVLQAQPQPRPGGGVGRQLDANADGKITRDEFPGPKELFDQFDKDKNNFLSADELEAMRQQRRRGGGGFRRPGQNQGGNLAEELFRSVDADRDKTLSAKEWQAYFGKILAEADTDMNGNLSAEEWQAWRRKKTEASRRPERGPKVGAAVPKVTAEFMTQKGALDFSKIKRHAVVVFGSYT